MSRHAKEYELNIEGRECNKPPVSLPSVTTNQIISLYICQVRRDCSS